MVHEHRNYLPIFGLILAGCFMVMDWIRVESYRRLITIAMVAYMLLMGVVTILRAEQWGDNLTHAVHEAENHPKSERAQLQLGRMFMLMLIEEPRTDYYVAAKEALEKSAQLSKVNITAHFSLIQLAFLTKQSIDPAVVAEAERMLASGPISPAAAGAFRALVDCQIFAYCKLPDDEVTRLANAALTNPRAIPGVTTQIAIYLVQYQIDKIGSGDLALQTLKNALARDPKSAALYLTAGKIYRVVGEFERSAQNLEQATRYDYVGTYRTAISDERQKLTRDRNKSRG
jgi:tetratricopeptide (TPR) repeat protein